MTVLELNDLINEVGNTSDLLYHEDMEEVEQTWSDSHTKIIVTKIQLADQKFPTYLQFTGSYNSWEGTQWEAVHVVEPVEVSTTKYKRI